MVQVKLPEAFALNMFVCSCFRDFSRLSNLQREIKTLEDKVGQKGMTVVPLKIFFNDDNR